MTTNQNRGDAPLVTEIKETESFGYHISLTDNTIFCQRVLQSASENPLDDDEQVIISLCESWKALQLRVTSLVEVIQLLVWAIEAKHPDAAEWDSVKKGIAVINESALSPSGPQEA